MEENPFIDENGLVRPNLWNRGENGIYFRAQLDLWANFNGNVEKYGKHHEAIHATFDPTKENFFRANPPETTDHFSIDNMLGLYVMCHLHQPDRVASLPVFYWNDRWNFHPNTWMVFLALKYPILKHVFAPFLWIMATYSGMSPCSDTTGFNLWWTRLVLLDMGHTLHWLGDLIEAKMLDCYPDGDKCSTTGNKKKAKEKLDGNPWDFSFCYYFTHGWEWQNFDHPTLLEIEEFLSKTPEEILK